MTLKDFFEQVPKAAAAFSGGTDSAFVLWAAKKYGCDVHAYYVRTAFQPEFELEDARRLAEELDIPMTVVDMDILYLQQCHFTPPSAYPGKPPPPRDWPGSPPGSPWR